MAILNDSQLTTAAQQIKNEATPLANTATRVGTMLENLVENKINKDAIDTSTGLGTSDEKVASQKAVKAYVDSATTGLLDDRGNYNASGNVFPSSGGSGTAGAIQKGDLWYISVAGTLGGTPVSVGTSVRALVDTPGQTSSNWSILSNGVGFTPENVANKSTNIASDTGSNTKYPTVAAVEAFVNTATASVPVTTKVTVSAAELLSLSNPYKVLVAAPGAGKARAITHVFFKYNAGTTNFAQPGNTTFFVYVCLTRPGGQTVSVGGTAILSQNISDLANFQPYQFFRPSGLTGIASVTDATITLANFGANLISGDGTLDVYVTYIDITL